MKEEKIDLKIGIYAITGMGLLVYIFWMSLEDVNRMASLTLAINIIWYIYSCRLLYVYAQSAYKMNYTINYMVCALGCFIIYLLDIPILFRNICILFLSCEGYVRTFFVEIRKLIKESKQIESQGDE